MDERDVALFGKDRFGLRQEGIPALSIALSAETGSCCTELAGMFPKDLHSPEVDPLGLIEGQHESL